VSTVVVPPVFLSVTVVEPLLISTLTCPPDALLIAFSTVVCCEFSAGFLQPDENARSISKTIQSA
jgi:hypothetical protein